VPAAIEVMARFRMSAIATGGGQPPLVAE